MGPGHTGSSTSLRFRHDAGVIQVAKLTVKLISIAMACGGVRPPGSQRECEAFGCTRHVGLRVVGVGVRLAGDTCSEPETPKPQAPCGTHRLHSRSFLGAHI